MRTSRVEVIHDDGNKQIITTKKEKNITKKPRTALADKGPESAKTG